MDFLVKPWEHQVKIIERSFVEPHLALLWEPGTGKSGGTINILRGRYASYKRMMKTLILCPQVVIPNWKNEFKLHSRIDQKEILALTGVGKRREQNLKEFLYSKEDMQYTKNKIVIVNYEALQNEEIMGVLSSWRPEIMVCDESHKLKDHSGKRAKLVYYLSQFALHRYILTGTPILNTLMDIFMQYKILDDGDTFGKNFWVFRDRYFEDANSRWKGGQNYFPKWRPREAMFPELQQRIYRRGMRAVKSECLDLPPLIKTSRSVEMSPEQTRMYKQMKDDYITYVDTLTNSGEKPAVIANLAMTKALRLQQIVSGFAKDADGTHHQLKEVPRLKALAELLDEIVLENGKKVIVWSVFKENYKMIKAVCEKMKLPFAELHGDITAKQKQEHIEEFRNGKAMVMIANQAAGGVGINLIEASYSIYYSKGFRLEDDLQSEARNYRGGSEQHDKITRIDLVCPGTIDELIDEALRMKLNIAEKILDWKEKI